VDVRVLLSSAPNGAIRVRWDGSTSGDVGAFRIERRECSAATGGFNDWQQVADVGATASEFIDSATTSGLVKYQYRVTPLCPASLSPGLPSTGYFNLGYDSASDTRKFRTGIIIDPQPYGPTGLKANADGGSTSAVAITWNAQDGASKYRVERSVDGKKMTDATKVWQTVGTVNAPTTSISDAALDIAAGQAIRYRVIAIGGCDVESRPNESTFPDDCGWKMPSSPVVTALTGWRGYGLTDTVQVGWSPVAGATGYEVLRFREHPSGTRAVGMRPQILVAPNGDPSGCTERVPGSTRPDWEVIARVDGELRPLLARDVGSAVGTLWCSDGMRAYDKLPSHEKARYAVRAICMPEQVRSELGVDRCAQYNAFLPVSGNPTPATRSAPGDGSCASSWQIGYATAGSCPQGDLIATTELPDRVEVSFTPLQGVKTYRIYRTPTFKSGRQYVEFKVGAPGCPVAQLLGEDEAFGQEPANANGVPIRERVKWYTDTDVATGFSYKYDVRVVRASDATNTFSTVGKSTAIGYPAYPNGTNVQCRAVGTAMEVTWQRDPGNVARFYDVYYRQDDDVAAGDLAWKPVVDENGSKRNRVSKTSQSGSTLYFYDKWINCDRTREYMVRGTNGSTATSPASLPSQGCKKECDSLTGGDLALARRMAEILRGSGLHALDVVLADGSVVSSADWDAIRAVDPALASVMDRPLDPKLAPWITLVNDDLSVTDENGPLVSVLRDPSQQPSDLKVVDGVARIAAPVLLLVDPGYTPKAGDRHVIMSARAFEQQAGVLPSTIEGMADSAMHASVTLQDGSMYVDFRRKSLADEFDLPYDGVVAMVSAAESAVVAGQPVIGVSEASVERFDLAREMTERILRGEYHPGVDLNIDMQVDWRDVRILWFGEEPAQGDAGSDAGADVDPVAGAAEPVAAEIRPVRPRCPPDPGPRAAD
jgi:hypothetical protein